MKKLSLAGALAVAALLVPASAFGSTASKTGNSITVNAGGGERNSIFVSFNAVGNSYTITDSAGITATPPCLEVNGTTVTCPDGTVTQIVVNAGNRNDAVTLDQGTILPTVRGFLNGEAGKDLLIGAGGADTLVGGSQGDTMNGRNGADVMAGGTGNDTVTYATNPLGVRVVVGAGSGDDGNINDATGTVRDTVGHNVERVIGTVGPDLIIGDGSGEVLLGLAGNDIVRGSGGADKVVGGPDDDKVVGGKGPDRVIGKGGRDIMKGKNGIDRIKARDGIRDRKINCGAGKDRFEFAKVDRIDPKPKKC